LKKHFLAFCFVHHAILHAKLPSAASQDSTLGTGLDKSIIYVHVSTNVSINVSNNVSNNP
jgi:hypothetical protein